jgi:multiple sugar transport system permease protein
MAIVAPQTVAPVTGDPDRPRRPGPTGGRITTPGRLWTYAGLTVAGLLTLMPFVWMVLGSFKSQGEILRNPSGWLPESATLENYHTWFFDLGIGTYFTNSVIVAFVTVLGNLLFCSMVGYALAKLEFPGKRVLFSLVMVMLMVPSMVTFIPLFVIVAKLHMINTYPGLILPNLTSPLGVFLMRQFMRSIPDSLIEAARIDGAGEIGSSPDHAAAVRAARRPSVLAFLASWNSFLAARSGPRTRTAHAPVALALYSTGNRPPTTGCCWPARSWSSPRSSWRSSRCSAGSSRASRRPA